MRTVLAALIALLVLSASARADVFVPADPPPSPSDCPGGAGDVLVAGSSTQIDVSLAGGPFAPLEGLAGCPLAAGADDGTAAIVGLSEGPLQLVVRRGGTFGAPIRLAETVEQRPGLAVARGGWAAVAWTAAEQRVATLWLLVVAPDGRETRTIVDRSRSVDIRDLSVGISPAGEAVVVWSRSTAEQSRVRVARIPAGGAPAISDLPGQFGERRADGPVQYGEYSLDGPSSVADAPGGATLIAWASSDGVRVLTGAGEPVLVSPSSDASRVTAAINDAGAALVVHQTASNEVVVVERAAGANWAAPRVVATYMTDRYSSTDIPANEAILTADGRAVVVWREERSGSTARERGDRACRRRLVRPRDALGGHARRLQPHGLPRCARRAARALDRTRARRAWRPTRRGSRRRHAAAGRRAPAVALGSDRDRRLPGRGAGPVLGGVRRAAEHPWLRPLSRADRRPDGNPAGTGVA